MLGTALSDGQLTELSANPPLDCFEAFEPNIITYTQLKHFGDIDEVLGDDGTAIILFQESNDNSGHWACLFRNGNTVHFYDSYGEVPDLQKNYLSGSARQRYYMKPELGELLLQSPYLIDYNDYQV